MIKKEIKTIIEKHDTDNAFDEIEKELIDSAKKIALSAYAPYSEFNVGAAVLLENNIIITGNNQENAAYPSGLCAERVALFYANAQYPDKKVLAIAIVAIKDNKIIVNPVPPCGSCRQAILETSNRFENKIKLILIGNEHYLVINNASELLPLSFSSDFVK